MKTYVLLSALLMLGCVRAAPVEQAGLEQGSCQDASAQGAAGLAIAKINADRQEGYRFDLLRLSNVHMKPHEEAGIVFYLTLDVVETNCSVLIRDPTRPCQPRKVEHTPVYGQCKAAIYISKIHRVVRLYKYKCMVRPVPAFKVAELCPDCPSLMDTNNDKVQKTVSLALEKFNRESQLSKLFSLLQVTRATSGMAMDMYYDVEFIIQETTCTKTAGATSLDQCPHMNCEFAHKGFCSASLSQLPDGKTDLSVNCEVFEPEAAEKEKRLHQMGGNDHSHSDAHAAHAHDHAHDHAAGHSHAHGHKHDHAHHAQAHDHTGDHPHQHHNYNHPAGTNTHDHDHELALDHDHKHAHLHEHEHHHHHHHDHGADRGALVKPEGMVIVLGAMDQPSILPAFPDVPAAGPEVGVTLPLKPDPQIPGVTEPIIANLPAALSAQCPTPLPGNNLVEQIFAADPMFNPVA